MIRYEQIGQYVRYIQGAFKVDICIKEFSNFIHFDRKLSDVLEPYKGHNTQYCRYVKQQLGHNKCLEMMRPMYDRCKHSKDGFTGVCYAGIFELVVPIYLNDELLGCINAGYVGGDPGVSRKLRERCFRRSSVSVRDQAEKYFLESIRPSDVSISTVKTMVCILADFLAINYGRLQLSGVSAPIPNKRLATGKEVIINTAIDYIKGNFESQMSVAEIAQVCRCSESYISHLFSRYVGINIKAYINRIRIEHSKRRLVMTPDKIAVVALDVGFSSPNYYSKVFFDLLGISPIDYRKRYTI